MTTRRLVVEAGVEAEIERAVEWYEKHRPELGLELTCELRSILAELLERPDKTLAAPGIDPALGVRRRLLPTFPYAVVVLERDDAVHVLAVAHVKKKPNYWLGRLRRVQTPDRKR